jgi:hypothetical protein
LPPLILAIAESVGCQRMPGPGINFDGKIPDQQKTGKQATMALT